MKENIWIYQPETGYVEHETNGDLYKVARVVEEINPEWQHEHGRLIAAAPELLAALDHLVHGCYDPASGALLRPSLHFINKARAALAKATGQE